MKKLFVMVTLAAAFMGCNEQNQKINHEIKIDTVATLDDRLKDSSRVIVSELPVKFDSTDILLYPIGMVDLKERGGYSAFGSGSYSSNSGIGSGYFTNDDFSGNFINIIFQDKADKWVLSKNKMTINRAIFLREIYNLTKEGYILYFIYDRDTNGDQKYDRDDVEALYISKGDGTKFKKLSPELHEFYDYRILKEDKKLYFRTLEDINKDGKLTNKDKFHYYQLQFIEDGYSVAEFNPLDIFN